MLQGRRRDEEGTHRQSSSVKAESWKAGIGSCLPRPTVCSPKPSSLSIPTKGMARISWGLGVGDCGEETKELVRKHGCEGGMRGRGVPRETRLPGMVATGVWWPRDREGHCA